ncbi:hypothetical protein O3G_MSEX009664, partial [Manduca sexta]
VYTEAPDHWGVILSRRCRPSSTRCPCLRMVPMGASDFRLHLERRRAIRADTSRCSQTMLR